MSARWGKWAALSTIFASCMIAPRAFGEDSAKAEAVAVPAVAKAETKGGAKAVPAVAAVDEANLHVALKDAAIRKRWDDVMSKMDDMEKNWTAAGRHITPIIDLNKDGTEKLKDDKKKIEDNREARRIAEEEDKAKQKAREEVETLKRDTAKTAAK
jgi:hypothetical protein